MRLRNRLSNSCGHVLFLLDAERCLPTRSERMLMLLYNGALSRSSHCLYNTSVAVLEHRTTSPCLLKTTLCLRVRYVRAQRYDLESRCGATAERICAT